MATSIIPRQIHEIKYMKVTGTKNNSNNIYLTASVPSGYKFLCWSSFSSILDWAASGNNLDQETVRVWTGQTNSKDVTGDYLVYR